MKNPKAVAKKIYEKQGGEPYDDYWMLHCICHHPDIHPSLRMRISNGVIRFKCFVGCDSEEIKEEFRKEGLLPKELKINRQLVATYSYRDVHGRILYQKDKYSNGKYDWKRRVKNKEGKVKWQHDLKGCKRVLYNLPDTIKAVKDNRIVFVVEGEKDVETMLDQDFAATTSPFGAGTWRKEYTETLRNGRIVIIPDNDEAGRKHALKVAGALYHNVKWVKILDLKYPSGGKDPSDWFEKEGTAKELQAIVKKTKYWMPEKVDLKEGLDEPGSDFNFQDFDNAQSFYGTYGDSLHHRDDLEWVYWDETRWVKDRIYKRYKYGKNVLTTLENEWNSGKDFEDRINLRSRKLLNNMIEVSKNDFAIDPNEFDSPRKCKYLLNLKNGTVDLRTGELNPHNRDNLITKLIPVTYNKDAECPMFSDWLDLVTDNNAELRRYLLQAAGYNFIGEAGERNIFVLYGDGNNGKTTLLSVLFWLMGGPQGDYASTIDTSTITKTHYDQIPTDLASLKGIRFAYCSEKLKQKELDIEMLKYMCGGEATLRARFMRQDYFNFEPVFKLWIMTNEKPFIDPDSKAIWNRLKIIPFIVDITARFKDVPLYWKRLLKAEGVGILNLILEGCRDYLENGLIEPPTVKDATEDFRKSLDEVQPILDEVFEIRKNYQSIDPEEVNKGNRDKYWCENSSYVYRVGKRIRMEEEEEKD